MADVVDLAGSPFVDLSEALRSEHAAVWVRLAEGGGEAPARPMLWPCEAPEVEAAQATSKPIPAVDVAVVRDACLGGPGGHVQREGRYVYAEAATPGFVRHWMEHDFDRQYWAFEPSKPIAVERVFAILHFNIVYGHWLTEIFPKLFVIKRLAEQGLTAPIALPSTAPAYVRDSIHEVLPGQAVLTYDPALEHIAAERVILPSMLNHFYAFHPWLAEDLDRWIAALPAARPGPERLFVSRAEVKPGFRHMINREEIEQVATDLGLRVVHPERRLWREQVALFTGARLVAGEFGSGMHNALFAAPGAKVVCLNWITDVQSSIATFRGQDVGYILDPDGRPRTYGYSAEAQAFRIDPATFAEHLSRLIEAADGRRRPRRVGLFSSRRL